MHDHRLLGLIYKKDEKVRFWVQRSASSLSSRGRTVYTYFLYPLVFCGPLGLCLRKSMKWLQNLANEVVRLSPCVSAPVVPKEDID